jgi:hypothetical protein
MHQHINVLLLVTKTVAAMLQTMVKKDICAQKQLVNTIVQRNAKKHN